MASLNKLIIVGNIGRTSYSDDVYRILSFSPMRQKSGLDHAPTLSITDGMPEAGGGGASASAPEAPAASDDDDSGDGDGEDDCRPPQRKHPSPGPEPHHSGIARPPARRNAGATPAPDPEIALWRLPTVLQHVPISRSGWWAGVKTGKFPQPVRLSSRCVAWRAADIRALVASL